jgi:NAD(P)-dependent dehydrogenase (short-subunit alcohol dehydrogenase family)
MKVEGQVVVVTGAAEGIGRALCERFAREGAEADVARVVEETERRLGPIGLWCSNAGVLEVDPDPRDAVSAPDTAWARSWGVNVMAHVYAARALLPRYIERGGGWFLNTVSAAGLLNQPGTTPYAVTKHAAIGFAESLWITHRGQGVRVAVLCPQGVQTAMLDGATHRSPAVLDGVLTPEQVADAAVEGLAAERFLILPHPQVADYIRHKATDYDRWLGGMAKLHRLMLEG